MVQNAQQGGEGFAGWLQEQDRGDVYTVGGIIDSSTVVTFFVLFFCRNYFSYQKKKEKEEDLKQLQNYVAASYGDYVYCATVFSYFLLGKSERFLAFFLEQSFSTFLSSVLQNPIPRFSCLMCNRRVGFLFNAAGCSSTTRSRYNLHY